MCVCVVSERPSPWCVTQCLELKELNAGERYKEYTHTHAHIRTHKHTHRHTHTYRHTHTTHMNTDTHTHSSIIY